MRQMIHIFQKDVVGLRGELGVFLSSVLIAAMTAPLTSEVSSYSLQSWGGEVLVFLSACYLIARLIQAEAIPGSNQFWTTRPYRWTSLLGAKALFVLVFAHLPVLIAQAALLRLEGFSVLQNLSGLFWMQLVMAAFVSLPVAAIAAVTSGLSGLALFGVVGLACGVFFSVLRASLSWRGLLGPVPSGIEGMFEWISYALLSVTLCAAALPVLFAQYRARRTGVSRLFLAVVYLIGLGVSFLGGAEVRWTIQTLASTKPLDTTSFKFSLGTPRKMYAYQNDGFVGSFVAEWPPASFAGTSAHILIPLSIEGMLPRVDVGAERLYMEIETVDGDILRPRSGFGGAALLFYDRTPASPAGKRDFSVDLWFSDGTVYEKLRGKSVTVRGFIDLFVMGNERLFAVPKTSFPYYVTNAFRCDLENISRIRRDFKDLSCKAAFRWPLQSIDVEGKAFMKIDSLSPFPVTPRFNPIMSWNPAQLLDESHPQVEFALREPVSYIRKTFEIQNVQLIEGPGTETGWKERPQ